jgi:hypothetical protein
LLHNRMRSMRVVQNQEIKEENMQLPLQGQATCCFSTSSSRAASLSRLYCCGLASQKKSRCCVTCVDEMMYQPCRKCLLISFANIFYTV